MRRPSYFLCLLLLLMFPVIALSQTSGPPRVTNDGKSTAPAFNLKSLKGEKLELEALRGSVVVLNFWFTGCEPCVAEFSELNNLVKTFKPKGVVFIAPTIDNEIVLKPFLKKHKFKYQIVANAGGLILNTYSDGSGNVVFPTHIVIDQDGRIGARLTGAKAVGELRAAIERLTNGETRR